MLQPPAVKIAAGASLDKTLFTRTFSLLALRIKPARCKFFMENFRKVLLNMPRLRNIVSDPVLPESQVKRGRRIDSKRMEREGE